MDLFVIGAVVVLLVFLFVVFLYKIRRPEIVKVRGLYYVRKLTCFGYVYLDNNRCGFSAYWWLDENLWNKFDTELQAETCYLNVKNNTKVQKIKKL